MRAPSFLRTMTVLALLAMALLALAPTISRLRAPDQHGGNGVWAEMCTLAGLKWVKLPGGDGAGIPKPSAAMGDDCAYCPLLNALATLFVLAVLLLPRLRADIAQVFFVAPRRSSPYPSGLGSRGPPLAF
ncbi:DUF2946 domain-containing protein [Arenimonas sp.]|uniref:DUF2946 domain-containing protein n=1 Tax=Arenimonas sp. TaxID=1872635 RepID=UPI002D1FB036|nr:DUF2946 domain-containing protein [Arenimonas sp.]